MEKPDALEIKKPETAEKTTYTEKELESDLFQKGRQSAIEEMNLPESAEQKMERLETMINELASLASQLSPELYAQDRNKFNELNELVQQKLAEIEVLMVTFETTINLEYPKVPLGQKLAVLLASLARANIRESTLIHTFGGNKAKKATLLNALQEFRTLHGKFRNQIEEIKLTPYRIEQQEILKKDSEYQKSVKDLGSLKNDLEIVNKFSPYFDTNQRVLAQIWERRSTAYRPYENSELKRQLISILEAKFNQTKENITRLEKDALIEAQKNENRR